MPKIVVTAATDDERPQNSATRRSPKSRRRKKTRSRKVAAAALSEAPSKESLGSHESQGIDETHRTVDRLASQAIDKSGITAVAQNRAHDISSLSDGSQQPAARYLPLTTPAASSENRHHHVEREVVEKQQVTKEQFSARRGSPCGESREPAASTETKVTSTEQPNPESAQARMGKWHTKNSRNRAKLKDKRRRKDRKSKPNRTQRRRPRFWWTNPRP